MLKVVLYILLFIILLSINISSGTLLYIELPSLGSSSDPNYQNVQSWMNTQFWSSIGMSVLFAICTAILYKYGKPATEWVFLPVFFIIITFMFYTITTSGIYTNFLKLNVANKTDSYTNTVNFLFYSPMVSSMLTILIICLYIIVKLYNSRKECQKNKEECCDQNMKENFETIKEQNKNFGSELSACESNLEKYKKDIEESKAQFKKKTD